MEEIRNRILEYSAKKFMENGFYKTSMDEIASELGMSKKTLYKYFDSKSDLVRQVAVNFIETQKKRVDEIIMDKKADIIEKLILLTKRNTDSTRMVNEKWHNDIRLHEPKLHKYCEKFQNESISRIATELIKQGKKEKVIEDYPPALIVESTNVLLRNLFSMEYVSGSGYSIDTIFTFIVNLLLNGVLTPRGKMKFKTYKKRRVYNGKNR
ncbi:MAG TPA: TetR/AcrR family transcriptional regulator [Ignavibacteria bacterium]|nr:TetR/AcrR family transcriptional regulator [Ignavibacteria bacterium]